MMTREEATVVRVVYTRLIENEIEDWSELDDNLEFCSMLSNEELINEAIIKAHKHSKGIFRCVENHVQEACLAPYILEASEAIVSLYQKTKELHEKNRYILLYYIALSELNLIYVS